jgi:FkbM family methyltransferase
MTKLAWVRDYRERRERRIPWRVRIPYVRNLIRNEARALWPGGYVFLRRDLMAYVPKPVDAASGYRLLKPYRPSAFIEILCKAGDTVIDVGANLGDWTLGAALAVGPAGRVLAFEPVPHVAEALARSAAINRFRWVTVFPSACSDRVGQVTYSVERENTAGSRLGTMPGDSGRTFEEIAVPSTTVDSVTTAERLSRVDLIKVDVEGFEEPVLRGAVETLGRFRPVLFLETGHESPERRIALADLCRGFGYRIAGVSLGGGLVDAGWDDYLGGSGAFAAGVADMVLLAT